nr:stage III sporulation protein AE [uncultured Dorea sp.]
MKAYGNTSFHNSKTARIIHKSLVMLGVVLCMCIVLCSFCLYTVAYADDTDTSASVSESSSEIRDAILSTFDYGEIDNSLKELFPDAQVKFEDVLSEILSGDLKHSFRLLGTFAKEQCVYLLQMEKKTLIYIVMIAMIAAVMNQFTGILQNRQVAGIGFYIIYLMLIALTITAFDVVLSKVEAGILAVTGFMSVFCPVYFLAVAVAKGSVTSVAFYNLMLFLIYGVELIIGKILLPVVRVYMMIRVLNFLTPEEMFEKFSELLALIVKWTLRTALACVIGVNLIQGMISPAIDTVRRSAVTKGAEAIPGVGNLLGGMTEVAIGTAVLVKNGIGMAGALICIALCTLPLIQIAATELLYKMTAVMIQPVSDDRVIGCVEAVAEGCGLLLQMVFTVGLLFLLTIAIVAALTGN